MPPTHHSRDDSAPPRLPVRPADGHKGTFGTVAIVGGCAQAGRRMIGGPALAAMGALRAGAGLVRLATPAPVLDAALTMVPSATGVPLDVDSSGELLAHRCAETLDALLGECACVAIGPGFGVGEGQRAMALRAAGQDELPVVLDADALNCLADVPELRRDVRAGMIITPHPGEFRRLAKSLGVLRDEKDPVDVDLRPGAAERLAQALGCVVVLKGAGTVVTDGARTWVNQTGNAALATAGTGDVLAGLVAGLVAQHHRPPILAGPRTVTSEQRGGLGLYDCARLAVRAHGRAADLWVRERGASAGLLAAELADLLPAALQERRDDA